MRRGQFGNILFYVIIAVILITTMSTLMNLNQTEHHKYSEIAQYFEEEQVESFTVEDDTLALYLKEPRDNGLKVIVFELYSVNMFWNEYNELIQEQYDAGIIKDYDYIPGWNAPVWASFLPYLILMIVIFVIWFVLMNRRGGGMGQQQRFEKARTKSLVDQGKKVTFNDVAGAEEEKLELQEVVEFLKDPRRFSALGARIPKGILLVGPPGTGKTLLAKAVAGEAGVQFLSISGSDFVELYVGVGASRVRDLFEQAKKASPSIVFIDEIDAVGRRRGAGLGGGHDEREQTLNQLLVEMDGFGSNQGVIVMAATNRQDILDPALLRPGRFDRQIYVGAPDRQGREDILKIHVRGKPLAEDVDLSVLAKSTTGFTGADLENLTNEAALLAARRGKRFLTMPEFEEAMLKVIAGPEKKSRVVPEQDRRLTAYHEAGHALVMRNLPLHDPVHAISIIPRGMAGGMTISLPTDDRSFVSRKYMEQQIVSLLGGRVAEKLVLDDISTGASNDIQRASAIARKMVTVYGMSDALGPISYETGHDQIFIGREMSQAKPYSEEVAAQIDVEVKAIIDKAYQQCVEILSLNRDKLDFIARYLLEYETMDAEVFEAVFSAPESIPGLIEDRKRKKEEALRPAPPVVISQTDLFDQDAEEYRLEDFVDQADEKEE